MSIAKTILGILGAACLAGPAAAQGGAQVTDEAAWALHGFGTLALARSSSPGADFVRDLSQPAGLSGNHWSGRTDTVLGLQASWRPNPDWEAVGQAVSRYRYDGTFRPELIWGFLKWTPTPRVELRGGRLGTDFFMLSDSRLVGYSFVMVRPPVEYFGTLPFSSIDGADAVFAMPADGGVLRFKLFAGRSREKAPLGDRQWDLDGSLLRGGHVDYQTGQWHWRAGYASVRLAHDLPLEPLPDALRAVGATAAADALSLQGRTSRFTSAGVVYEPGPWRLQLMVNDTRHDGVVFQNSRSGYALAGYRLDRVTPFVGYAWTRSTPKSLDTGIPAGAAPALDALNAAVARVLADSRSHQHTVSLGVRWDFSDRADFKLQFDAVRGASDSIFLTRRDTPGWTGRTNVLTAVIDFVF